MPTFKASKVTGKSHGDGMEPLKTPTKKVFLDILHTDNIPKRPGARHTEVAHVSPQPIPVSLPVQEALPLCPGVALYPRTRKCINGKRRHDPVSRWPGVRSCHGS